MHYRIKKDSVKPQNNLTGRIETQIDNGSSKTTYANVQIEKLERKLGSLETNENSSVARKKLCGS